jgi:hypothetical protein
MLACGAAAAVAGGGAGVGREAARPAEYILLHLAPSGDGAVAVTHAIRDPAASFGAAGGLALAPTAFQASQTATWPSSAFHLAPCLLCVEHRE